MSLCFGSMGTEGWFAKLDFANSTATVLRRGKDGARIGPIAEVPLGAYQPETEYLDPQFVDDEQNRNLLLIIAAPVMVQALQRIHDVLAAREEHCQDMELLRECRNALEWTQIPPMGYADEKMSAAAGGKPK